MKRSKKLLVVRQMKQEVFDIKLRIPKEGLHIILLERISSCKKPGEEIIKFPPLFSKIASSFSIPKKKVWPLLYFLNDLGFIKIVFGHGIKLNYQLTKNEK